MTTRIKFRHLATALAFGLSLTVLMFSCSKTNTFTPPVTTSLASSIDSAQWYLANTHEGTQPGEYTKGTQATLAAALAAAQAVLTAATTSGTQAQITAATVNLNQAVAAYEAGLIIAIAPSSLVAYWKFNGNANDSSGNGHNGTLEACPPNVGGVGLIQVAGVALGGAPNLTTDRFGNANSAYHFSNGGNIDVPYSPAFNPTAISVSVWFRQDTAGRIDGASNCYLISLSRWNGWKLQNQPTLPFFSVTTDSSEYDRDDAGTAVTIGTTVGAGPWSHVIVTYDGNGTESFYINGVLVKTWTNLAGTVKAINPTYDLSIGTDLPNSAYNYSLTSPNYIAWGGYWTGDMDDIMIYNIALTSTQVTQIYNQQVTQ
jgi:hypothetical protein